MLPSADSVAQSLACAAPAASNADVVRARYVRTLSTRAERGDGICTCARARRAATHTASQKRSCRRPSGAAGDLTGTKSRATAPVPRCSPPSGRRPGCAVSRPLRRASAPPSSPSFCSEAAASERAGGRGASRGPRLRLVNGLACAGGRGASAAHVRALGTTGTASSCPSSGQSSGVGTDPRAPAASRADGDSGL